MAKDLKRLARELREVESDVLSGDYRPLLPFLEYGYERIDEVRSSLLESGVSERLRAEFAETAILGALRIGESWYWTDFALRWLEGGAPMTPRILTALEAADVPRSEQRIRHRILGLRRQHAAT